jgi:DNA-binding CsgD family transcriptional regulator
MLAVVSGAGRGRPRYPDVLTAAEGQVADAVRHGRSYREIARRRGTSRDAEKFHVANAVMKLGLAGPAGLRAWPGMPADSALRAAGREDEDTAMNAAASADAAAAGLQVGPLGQVAPSCQRHRQGC